MKFYEKVLAVATMGALIVGLVFALITPDFYILRSVFFTIGCGLFLSLIAVFLIQTKSTLLKVILCFMALNIIGTYFGYKSWPLSTILLILSLGRFIFPLLLLINLKTNRFQIPHYHSGLIALLYILPFGRAFLEFGLFFNSITVTSFLMVALIGHLFLKKYPVDLGLKRILVIVLIENFVMVLVSSFASVKDIVSFFVE